MKKIAIFVSGSGEAAERVVKLFNEGNRVKTVLVVADDSAQSLAERLKEEDVVVLNVTRDDWHGRIPEIVSLLKDNDVKLIALDGFDLDVPGEIMEVTNGEVLSMTSADMAPREVVNALEADLRKPVVEEPEVEAPQEDVPPSLESEWADTLKINYQPPKIPQTPPDVPNGENAPDNGPSGNPDFQGNGNQTGFNQGGYNQGGYNQGGYGQGNYNSGGYHPYHHNSNRYYERREERNREEYEPMPSTWLIWSVLCTIFCCFIPGIIAIIFSSQVSSKYYAGDIEGARRASRMAEAWIIVSVVLGVIAATLYLPFMLIGN